MKKIRDEYTAFNDSCIRGVIGDSLTITCDKRGKVIQVTGVERIMEKITRATGKDSRDVYSSLREIFSTKELQDLLTQVFFYIPARPVKLGDNWVNNYTLTAKAPVKFSNLITVQRINGDSVVMDIKTVVSAKTGEGGRVYAEDGQWGTVTASLASGMVYNYRLEDTLRTKTDSYLIGRQRILTVSAQQ